MDRTLPKDMPLYKPLAIEPSALPAQLNGVPVRLLIRIYDVGVVTVMRRLALAAGFPGGVNLETRKRRANLLQNLF